MSIYSIHAEYATSGTSQVELPDEKTWDDISDWHVKWDTFYATFKDGTKFEAELDSPTDVECTDWKRPIRTEVYPIDADGDVDYGEPLDERG
jgi:hypothetical protein